MVVPRTCLAARFTPGATLSSSVEGSALCCSGAGGGGSRDEADVSRALHLTHSQPARGLSVRAWACHTPTSCRAAAHRPEPPAQSCATHARGAPRAEERCCRLATPFPFPLISEALRQSSRSRFPLAGGRAEQKATTTAGCEHSRSSAYPALQADAAPPRGARRSAPAKPATFDDAQPAPGCHCCCQAPHTALASPHS